MVESLHVQPVQKIITLLISLPIREYVLPSMNGLSNPTQPSILFQIVKSGIMRPNYALNALGIISWKVVFVSLNVHLPISNSSEKFILIKITTLLFIEEKIIVTFPLLKIWLIIVTSMIPQSDQILIYMKEKWSSDVLDARQITWE